MELKSVIHAKKQNCGHLLGRSNVVACGVGFKETGGKTTDELCVVVSVTKKKAEAWIAPADRVPKKLGAVSTDVREVGVIRALQDRTARWRPAPGGVSIGHVDITAGTLGCLVTRGDELFILSNNHVLANTNAAQIGDPIIQPGRYDGGTLADEIATLEAFVPIDFGAEPPSCPIAVGLERLINWMAELFGSKHRIRAFRRTAAVNRVDAAIARPLGGHLVQKMILKIYIPRGARDASLGTRVRKSGRTTGLTTGRISQIDVTSQVSYGDGKIALFEDQLMAGAMSQGGDSGSAVLDADDYVIGLLFAGSDAVTIINPIRFVLEALNVEIAVIDMSGDTLSKTRAEEAVLLSAEAVEIMWEETRSYTPQDESPQP